MQISLNYHNISGTPITASQESGYTNNEIEQAFAGMVGLNEAKQNILEICAYAVMQKKRTEHHLKAENNTLHMVFSGSPGTGKTSVARIYGRLLKGLGLLSKGQLVETERADLVGEYIGHTAIKTRELIKRAMGGILFIDEAYSLCQGGEKDFGKEAVATLVKAMEDRKNDFVVILAGYSEEMDDFIHSNPGLRSRFPIQIYFQDYQPDELFAIALQMYEEREYVLSSRARWKLKAKIEEMRYYDLGNGNARSIRNLVERSIRLHALRLLNYTQYSKKDMTQIEDIDLEVRYK